LFARKNKNQARIQHFGPKSTGASFSINPCSGRNQSIFWVFEEGVLLFTQQTDS